MVRTSPDAQGDSLGIVIGAPASMEGLPMNGQAHQNQVFSQNIRQLIPSATSKSSVNNLKDAVEGECALPGHGFHLSHPLILTETHQERQIRSSSILRLARPTAYFRLPDLPLELPWHSAAKYLHFSLCST
jgi:hypothetical protein